MIRVIRLCNESKKSWWVPKIHKFDSIRPYAELWSRSIYGTLVSEGARLLIQPISTLGNPEIIANVKKVPGWWERITLKGAARPGYPASGREPASKKKFLGYILIRKSYVNTTETRQNTFWNVKWSNEFKKTKRVPKLHILSIYDFWTSIEMVPILKCWYLNMSDHLFYPQKHYEIWFESLNV